MSAGKGSRPRNCFSKNFKNNYDSIRWNKENLKHEKRKPRQKHNSN